MTILLAAYCATSGTEDATSLADVRTECAAQRRVLATEQDIRDLMGLGMMSGARPVTPDSAVYVTDDGGVAARAFFAARHHTPPSAAVCRNRLQEWVDTIEKALDGTRDSVVDVFPQRRSAAQENPTAQRARTPPAPHR